MPLSPWMRPSAISHSHTHTRHQTRLHSAHVGYTAHLTSAAQAEGCACIVPCVHPQIVGIVVACFSSVQLSQMPQCITLISPHAGHHAPCLLLL